MPLLYPLTIRAPALLALLLVRFVVIFMSHPLMTSRLPLTALLLLPQLLLSGCSLLGSWETLPCEEDERVQDGACVPCIIGAFNEAGDDPQGENTSCAARTCNEDEYVEDHTCKPCPAGQTRQAGDLTLESDTSCEPLVCARNERVEAGACVACEEGLVNAPGDVASGADTSCDVLLCEQDQYVLDNACTPCAAGTSRAAGDPATGPDTACVPALCQENEFVQDNACVACASGEMNAAGDDASGEDTICDGALCSEDTFVVSNMCLSCPSGTTNAAGDDPAGADTSCDTSFCAQDEWVQNNQCVPCPAGTTNEPGDPTGGTNTSCDPILCEEDERVSSNTCVPCEQGTTNMGGDSAKGPDTMCDALCPFNFENMCVDPIPTFIKASNTQSGDQFGYSIAMDGDTLVVGTPRESSNATGVHGNQQDNTAVRSGAVYVFVRGTDGQWSQQAYLKASNTDPDDAFGSSVAISGDTIVVGAPGESGNGTQTNNALNDCGAAYVFERDSSGTWSQQDFLKHTNIDVGDRFGESVAISGDTIVVGAPFEDSASTSINGNQNQDTKMDSGAAYVFVREGSSWMQRAYIKASNSEEQDHFGMRVAISANTIAVSAPDEDSSASGVQGNQQDNSAVNSGSVYIYRSMNTSWEQRAYIKASNTEQVDNFGASLALHGDTLVVGAPKESSNATGVNGNQNSNAASDSGAAYVFVENAGTWSQQAYLKASNTGAEDRFGRSVAIHGNAILVGAHEEDSNATGFLGADAMDNSSSNAGAAYIYVRDPQSSEWSFGAYVKATNSGMNDRLGWSVAITADAIAAAAYTEGSDATGIGGAQDNDNMPNSGAIYVTDFIALP